MTPSRASQRGRGLSDRCVWEAGAGHFRPLFATGDNSPVVYGGVFSVPQGRLNRCRVMASDRFSRPYGTKIRLFLHPFPPVNWWATVDGPYGTQDARTTRMPSPTRGDRM